MQRINLRENPKLKQFVKRAFPGYRKRDVWLSIVEPGYVLGTGTDWDGGSRDSYCLITKSGQTKPIGGQNWGLPREKWHTHTFANGDIVVQSGTLMGKPSMLHIYATENYWD